LILLLIVPLSVGAAGKPAQSKAPYNTFTQGPGGAFYITQDAYTPLDEIDLPVASPEEMFLAGDGSLYIADTGNARIVRLDAAFKVAAEYGKGILKSPTGLYVDEAGTLYIADAGKNTVIMLDKDGKLIREFGRPSEPLYGKSQEFLPRKIAVDARKNIYIVSEGAVNGLTMMNTNGYFIGYFGANSAEMSLRMIVQRLFLSSEQLAQFVRNEAASPSNIAIDSQSLVYTVSAGTTEGRSIRKFNIAGKNLFPEIIDSNVFRDVEVSDDGLIIAVDADGILAEYAQNGTLLFYFGAKDEGAEQRLGMLSNPVAVERAGDDLYVLDKNKNAIVSFRATSFARKVHEGVRLYMGGFYKEAKPYFDEVLTYNGLFIMAYQALASAYYKEGDFANALQAYRIAESRNGYSETFWELRNAVLQRSLGGTLTGLFGLWVVFGVFNRLERRRRWLDPVRHGLQALRKIRLIDDFAFMFRFIRQPSDSFYYIKQNLRGSLLFAFVIYAWVVAVRVVVLYVTGFIFSPYSTSWQINPEMEIVTTLGLIVLWNAANYLVSTISDGEGKLRHVIIGSAYSLFPYVLFALPIALISNVLTRNEAFLYSFSTQLMWLWVGIMLVIMVKEIHNYSFSETVRNIVVTVFTMAIFLLTLYVLYVLFSQLYEFVLALIREVGLRG
jgi:tetratricopeptide (TPR) repeat protein